VKWSDVVCVYEKEVNHIVKRTTLTQNAVYPNNVAKQNVSLVLQVFNDKTVSALQQDGHLQTAEFIAMIIKLWNILNVKTPTAHIRLNDPDRSPFVQNDSRITFILDFIDILENWKCGHGRIRHTFTTETRDALVPMRKSFLSISQTLVFKYNLKCHPNFKVTLNLNSPSY